MILSISGDPGSGKSTVAKRLAAELGLDYFYIGGIRREMAAKRGITLEEYNKLGETDPSTDLEADEYAKDLGRTHANFIIDGRLGWYFVPQSLKIYLAVDPRSGAERVWKQLQRSNERNEGLGLETVENVMRAHSERKASDNFRYRKYYGVDAFNGANFDFVLDTTNMDKEGVFTKVLERVHTHY